MTGLPYRFFAMSPEYVSIDCVHFYEVPEGVSLEDFVAQLRAEQSDG